MGRLCHLLAARPGFSPEQFGQALFCWLFYIKLSPDITKTSQWKVPNQCRLTRQTHRDCLSVIELSVYMYICIGSSPHVCQWHILCYPASGTATSCLPWLKSKTFRLQIMTSLPVLKSHALGSAALCHSQKWCFRLKNSPF